MSLPPRCAPTAAPSVWPYDAARTSPTMRPSRSGEATVSATCARARSCVLGAAHPFPMGCHARSGRRNPLPDALIPPHARLSPPPSRAPSRARLSRAPRATPRAPLSRAPPRVRRSCSKRRVGVPAAFCRSVGSIPTKPRSFSKSAVNPRPASSSVSRLSRSCPARATGRVENQPVAWRRRVAVDAARRGAALARCGLRVGVPRRARTRHILRLRAVPRAPRTRLALGRTVVAVALLHPQRAQRLEADVREAVRRAHLHQPVVHVHRSLGRHKQLPQQGCDAA
eukprot:2862602-Prymnesium_polylepis.1